MRPSTVRWLPALLAFLAFTGCAIDPWSQVETGTPALTPAQVAALEKRAQTPEQLGLQSIGGAFYGLNETAGAETVTVPLVRVPADQPRLPGGQYRVPVVLATVNGTKGVPVLLDSGSNQLLLGYSLARDLRLPLVVGLPPARALGIGGAVDNYVAVVPELKIGALTLRRLIALIGPDVQALNFTRNFWGQRPALILGINSLSRLSYLSIDNCNGAVTFSPVDSYQPDGRRALVAHVPLRSENGLPVVEVSVDSRPPVACVLDTGGDYGLLAPRSLAGQWGYWNPGKERLATSRGVAGASLTATYNVQYVKLGEALFAQVPARTDLVGPEPAGGRVLLGNVVLRRHKVTFDFRHGALWLER